MSIMFLFLIEAAIDILPDIFGKKSFPQLAVVFLLVPTIMLFEVLKKSGLIKKFSKTFRLLEYSENLTDDRSRLFKTVTVIFEIGSALSFLIGYFGMKKDIGYELLLAASLLSMGVIVRLIPFITKKHTVQNTIFLTISIIGMLYLVNREAEKGAITVWAIYILFMILNIILDSTFHAYFFAALSVITQIVFMITRPETSVIINEYEYLSRILIIVLSFVSVRFLTAEYALKVKDYIRFAREQEALERISSSFISVNSENIQEKIDEMLKTAAKILEYDYAFLIDFDKDYEEATIFNMYLKDIENKTFPYYPGMKFNLTDLPFPLQSMIDRKTPIMCEDITSLFLEEAGKKKDYFGYEGIDSFISVPITIDDEVVGIFFIEYAKRIDKSLAERRLNFLKIIAYNLGDTKTKTLYEERLYHFAYFDGTTKIANRNMLKKNLQQVLYNRKEAEKIAIFDIELDNLRMINDTFGHDIGNQIVSESASILKNRMKEECDIYRIGESKFIIVMPIAETAEQIEECANIIVGAFSNPILPKEGIEALFVTPIIGIAVYPDDGKDVDTLLQNADLAGYEAKASGNKIVICSERLKSRIVENTILTNRLFNSLQNEEFFLEFQPQINCKTEKTVGLEALLRWNYDDQKRIPPDIFIPILEQTGLIYDVGLWVLEQALQEHNRLISKGFPPLRISVNLSVVQFQEKNFILDFTKIIKRSQVQPKYIELEITESLLSKNPEDIIKKLHKLKELGIKIAIDDFGKGYSSLNRLKFVPFDRIKIDKDIIDYIDVERKIAPMTEIIILLARAYNASITAEGVETKEQAHFLKSIACNEVQGYYYSKPLSAEALEEFLKKE